MSRIAIKIIPDNKISRYLAAIKKVTSLGLSEIKSKIENDGLLVETDANDLDEMRSLKDLMDTLIKLDANVKIYDMDESREAASYFQEISYEEFKNNMDRLEEIMEELQDYDDEIADSKRTDI